MSEPKYYNSNGLSPIGAMKQGLISKEQYQGFLIGNIIKYVIRAGKKDDAIKDLEKAKDYIDFYIELFKVNVKDYGNIPMTIHVNNDINWDKFKEDISKTLEEANNSSVLIKPTDNPHIMELELSDVMYNDDGKLKPEVREKIKEYLQKRRENKN